MQIEAVVKPFNKGQRKNKGFDGNGLFSSFFDKSTAVGFLKIS